jgi:hypothetical protein
MSLCLINQASRREDGLGVEVLLQSFLTEAIGGGGRQSHPSAAFSPEKKSQVPITYDVGWASQQALTQWKKENLWAEVRFCSRGVRKQVAVQHVDLINKESRLRRKRHKERREQVNKQGNKELHEGISGIRDISP